MHVGRTRTATRRRGRATSLLLAGAGLLGLCCVPPGDPFVPFEFPFALSVIVPSEDDYVGPNKTAKVQWIDEGMSAGAVIRLEVSSTDEAGNESKSIILSNRDAMADGASDTFDWDGRNDLGQMLPARRYRVIAVLDNPDGAREIRQSSAQIVIPFNFLFTGVGGSDGILANNGGSGPFTLRDNTADFVKAGVQSGRTARIFSGSGSVVGNYTISSVTETVLQLSGDAGDSGGEADVRYIVQLSNPAINDDNGSVAITWQDSEYATNSQIRLEADPDTDDSNGNAKTILNNRQLGPDEASDQFEWDGSDVDAARLATGSYYIRAIINPGQVNQLKYLSDTKIQVDGVLPTLNMTNPSADTMGIPGSFINIIWVDSSSDPEAVLSLGIDPDTDQADPLHNSGNEKIIKSGIKVSDTENRFQWFHAGTRQGTYTIFGVITDSANNRVVDAAPGRVILPNLPPFFEFVRPKAEGDDNGANVTNNSGLGPFLLNDPNAQFVTLGVIAGNIVEFTAGSGVTPGEYEVSETPTSETQLKLETNPGDSFGAGDVEYTLTGDIEVVVGNAKTTPYRAHDPEEVGLVDFVIDFDDTLGNLNEIELARNVALPMQDDPADLNFLWSATLDADGNAVPPATYAFYGRTSDATNTRDIQFEGAVRVVTGVGEPRIVLDAPLTDVTANVNGAAVAITWVDEDTDGSTTITLRYDDDSRPLQSSETGAAEVTIQAGINADPDPDDVPAPPVNPDRWLWDWHPDDITQPAVAAGQYHVFAYIGNNGDPVTNPDHVSVASGRVTIPNTPPELEFTTPGATNAEFDSDDGVNELIAWNQRDPDAGDTISINLFLDPDSEFNNNNEYRIANNYTGGSPFSWNGGSIDRGPVDEGPYRVVAVLSTPSNSAVTVTSNTLIHYRPNATTPVITLASLFDPVTVNQNSTFTIRWADITVVGNETITLEYDTDNNPNNGVVDTIVSGLSANADGDADRFNWEVVNVASGEYFIHARLKSGGGSDVDVATSKSKLKVTGVGVPTTLNLLTPVTAGVDVALNQVTGTTANVANGGGGGPFTLTDGGADFVNDGVMLGDAVRITSGTGATPGVYEITNVAATTLTLATNAGSSGGAGNVNYSVRQTVDIIWDYQSNEDGVISLEADPDTTNNNSNDILIVSNRTQPAAPTPSSDQVVWQLTTSAGADVPTGIYNIRGILNVPDATLVIDLANGQVRLRRTPNAPLVTLTNPNSNTTYNEDDIPGNEIQITWNVNSLGGSPRVDLWFDDSQSEEAGTGDLALGAALSALSGLGTTAGIIAEDLPATPSALTWTPPAFITATPNKTYYIHIRIREAALPDDDDRATARGIIRINP